MMRATDVGLNMEIVRTKDNDKFRFNSSFSKIDPDLIGAAFVAYFMTFFANSNEIRNSFCALGRIKRANFLSQ
jgi:hypothetical protein